MPKITEVPPANPLSGTEKFVLVQDDETRVADVDSIYPRPASLPEVTEPSGAEWISIDVDGVQMKLSLFNLAQYLGSAPGAPVPIWDVAPSITGTVQVGDVLTGDDGELRFGAVTARAWLRDGAAISGATGATYELDFADQDADIAYRVTATGDGGTTIATSAEVGPVIGLALAQAPSFDTFDANPGNIIGRTLQGRGGTWTLQKATDALGGGTHDTSMSVAAGFAGGNGVAGAGNHYAVATAPSQTVIVARRLPNPFGANLSNDHVTASGNTVVNITRFGFTSTEVLGPPLSGRININREIAGGSATSIRAINGLRREPYDVQAHEYLEADSTVTLQMRMNGRGHDAPQDVSEAVRSVPLSRRHGFSGNAPATHLDWFAIVEPANDAVAMLEQAAPVISRLADGRALVIVQGRYTVQGMGKVKALVNDRSSGSPVAVAGYAAVDVAVTVTEISGLFGTFKGMFYIDADTAAGLAGKPLETWIWRTDVENPVGGGLLTVPWPSMVQRLGINVLMFGQSLSVFQSNQTQTTAATPHPGSRWVDGYAATTNAYDRRMLVQTANALPAHLSQRFGQLSGLPMTLVAAGTSGTPQSQRVPGTAQFNAAFDGIMHAGGRVDVIVNTTGQSNVDNAVTYFADLSATYAGPGSFATMDSDHPPHVVMMPISSSHSGSEQAYQAAREVEKRCVEDGIAHSFGPSTFDLRKHWNGTDLLHHGTADTDPHGSEAKIMQRIGQHIAFVTGDADHDGQGPDLVAAIKTGLRELKLYFDDGGSWFDSMELVGAGFHGGCRYSANDDGSAPIWPSNAVVTPGRVASGTHAGRFEVTVSFAVDLPAGLKVWSGFGNNPHNPLQDPTINQTTWDDPVSGASILRGVKTGMPAGLDLVGIRPRVRYHTPSYLEAA
ncbi:hypothetical protein HGI47_18490 [Novosphingobium sp. ERN07]|uniref:hypothetical protein n=1 Tax=Novosphingobium sp. ERN07 TaxID=2726187 RepID=UPI00145681DF|nr:hypothetical protein [Novosphingobium sp. ERN07]NLR72868.1 hypothetical protein [Novosphingobium sp. ERN07]